MNCPVNSCKKKTASGFEKKCDSSEEYNIKKGIIVGGKVFKLFNKEFRSKMTKKIKSAD